MGGHFVVPLAALALALLNGRLWLVLVMTPEAPRLLWVQTVVDAALNQKGELGIRLTTIIARIRSSHDDNCRAEREHNASPGKTPPGGGEASPAREQATYERDRKRGDIQKSASACESWWPTQNHEAVGRQEGQSGQHAKREAYDGIPVGRARGMGMWIGSLAAAVPTSGGCGVPPPVYNHTPLLKHRVVKRLRSVKRLTQARSGSR